MYGVPISGSLASGDVLIYNGTDWVPSMPANDVASVTASAPLASSGGTNPSISLTGTVAVGNGGTGLDAIGTANQVLYSSGSTLAYAGLSTDTSLHGNGLGTAFGLNLNRAYNSDRVTDVRSRQCGASADCTGCVEWNERYH